MHPSYVQSDMYHSEKELESTLTNRDRGRELRNTVYSMSNACTGEGLKSPKIHSYHRNTEAEGYTERVHAKVSSVQYVQYLGRG